ncbi:MAG TPA: glycosyl hydrolase family 18 protein [Patescibacteria group bacterium]
MVQKLVIILAGLVAGAVGVYFLLTQTTLLNFNPNSLTATPTPKVGVKATNKPTPKPNQKQVIGFLPFWLLDKAEIDYSRYITTLNYFSLTIDKDGTIQKYTNAIEGEPGYFALKTGKADPFLNKAKEKNISLSLAVFSGDEAVIEEILKDPVKSADNLVNDVVPIMEEYGFSDLNLDVESVKDATPQTRANYTQFVKEVKKGLASHNAGTLTVDASAIAFVKDTNLVDPKAIAESIDYMVLMAYDFHNPGSYVTGAVAPLSGAGTVSEFDTETAVQSAIKIMPSSKVILGMPLYGYSWETINNTPRSAIVPGSAIIISTQKVEEFLKTCTNCESGFDNLDQEEYVIYRDTDTGTYHQIFYPTSASTGVKVSYAASNRLGGVAVWALGYEDSSILGPLAGYHY